MDMRILSDPFREERIQVLNICAEQNVHEFVLRILSKEGIWPPCCLLQVLEFSKAVVPPATLP